MDRPRSPEPALSTRGVRRFEPGSFRADAHFYPRARDAELHPTLAFFLQMGNGRIAARYGHLHPEVDPAALVRALGERPRYFRWGGADLFCVTTRRGQRQIVVVETNSSPSGQKSMPRRAGESAGAGYARLVAGALLDASGDDPALPAGGLAVLTDKNELECTGYAAAMADAAREPVWLVPCHDGDPDPRVRFTPLGVLEVRPDGGPWVPIRAALRYVTQRPWNRIPLLPRTRLLNPVLACVAGGRNKLLAAKAYDLHNAELAGSGLAVKAPETIWDVAKDEVPLWVQRMGGLAVVKNPYSNAGQGVYTITSEAELAAFLADSHPYGRFIVQSLIGNSSWRAGGKAARYFHVGTVPDQAGDIYVADLRFMVGAGVDGFFPAALYARRARAPLARTLDASMSSWDMLGTNLSVRRADGSWDTDTERLVLVDRMDFDRLGLGLDDLVLGYVQTVLAVSAIDRMARQLVAPDGTFRRAFFAAINPDERLCAEILG